MVSPLEPEIRPLTASEGPSATDLPNRELPAASQLDAAGRKVAELCPGANDVRALAPGVYFVREAQAQAVRKVVKLK